MQRIDAAVRPKKEISLSTSEPRRWSKYVAGKKASEDGLIHGRLQLIDGNDEVVHRNASIRVNSQYYE